MKDVNNALAILKNIFENYCPQNDSIWLTNERLRFIKSLHIKSTQQSNSIIGTAPKNSRRDFLQSLEQHNFTTTEELLDYILASFPDQEYQLADCLLQSIRKIVGFEDIHCNYLISVYQADNTTFDGEDYNEPGRDRSKQAIENLIDFAILTSHINKELQGYLKTSIPSSKYGTKLLEHFNNNLLGKARTAKCNLYKQVAEIYRHGKFLVSLPGEEEKEMGNRTIELHDKLKALMDSFFSSDKPRDSKAFMQKFRKLLHENDSIMKVHRARWKPIIANVLIALTIVGAIALLLNIICSVCKEGRFSFNSALFFATTTREQLIDNTRKPLTDTQCSLKDCVSVGLSPIF